MSPGRETSYDFRFVFCSVFAQPRSWLRAVLRRKRLEAEMEAELASHLEALTADLMRAGHAPEDAARRARIALGPALAHKEEMRASLGLRWWDELGSGPALRRSDAAQESRIHGDCRGLAGAGHRREYDHLLRCQEPVLRSAGRAASGAASDAGLAGATSMGRCIALERHSTAPDAGMKSACFSYPVFSSCRRTTRDWTDCSRLRISA